MPRGVISLVASKRCRQIRPHHSGDTHMRERPSIYKRPNTGPSSIRRSAIPIASSVTLITGERQRGPILHTRTPRIGGTMSNTFMNWTSRVAIAHVSRNGVAYKTGTSWRCQAITTCPSVRPKPGQKPQSGFGRFNQTRTSSLRSADRTSALPPASYSPAVRPSHEAEKPHRSYRSLDLRDWVDAICISLSISECSAAPLGTVRRRFQARV